jgi:aconitase B
MLPYYIVRLEMVHDTPARRKARELKAKAQELEKEASALETIKEVQGLAEEKGAKAVELRKAAEELAYAARLEDLSVIQEPLIKTTKKGEKRTYYRWVASWREGDKIRKVYVGSCKKMSQAKALQKARKMKMEALGIISL